MLDWQRPSSLLFPAFAALAALVALLGLAADAAADGAIHYVAPDADCGEESPCYASVQAALDAATDGDEVHIAAGVYTESLTIDNALTLVGAGSDVTFLDGGGSQRVVRVANTTARIIGVTIQNGQTDSFAGGIMNAGTLSLENCVVRWNRGFEPGGIYNNGVMTLLNSAIYSNTAQQRAGGIWNSGPLTLTDTLVSDNRAKFIGGILNSSGPLTIERSVIRANHTDYEGGGLFMGPGNLILQGSTIAENQAENGAGLVISYNGTAVITGSTVSGNFAVNNYGGLDITTSGPVTITNSTISGNQAQFVGGVAARQTAVAFVNVTVTENQGRNGAGLWASNMANVTLHNTILAGNVDPNGVTPDCNGTVTSLGHNLIGNDTNCTLTPASGDLIGNAVIPLDPELEPLAESWAVPATHMPRPDSPVIDAGDDNGCPAVDQREVLRPKDGDNDGMAVCDIGAVEYVVPRQLFLPLLQQVE